MKLNIDGYTSLIRKRVVNKTYSRSAYDIAISLHYFGGLYKLYKAPEDKEAFQAVSKDLKHMMVQDLTSLELDYLIRGIFAGLE